MNRLEITNLVMEVIIAILAAVGNLIVLYIIWKYKHLQVRGNYSKICHKYNGRSILI